MKSSRRASVRPAERARLSEQKLAITRPSTLTRHRSLSRQSKAMMCVRTVKVVRAERVTAHIPNGGQRPRPKFRATKSRPMPHCLRAEALLHRRRRSFFGDDVPLRPGIEEEHAVCARLAPGYVLPLSREGKVGTGGKLALLSVDGQYQGARDDRDVVIGSVMVQRCREAARQFQE